METIKQQILDTLSDFVVILNLSYNYNLNTFTEEDPTRIHAYIVKCDTKSRFVHIIYYKGTKNFYVEVYHWGVKKSTSCSTFFKNIEQCKNFIEENFDSVDTTYKTVFKFCN